MSAPSLIKVTPVGFKILKALCEYRFLTTNQMIDLGIASDRGYLGQQLTSLLSVKRKPQKKVERKPKEIGELDFGVKVGKGRLPRLYYLTKRGADLLEHLDPELSPVRFPNRVTHFANDYEHRVSCVDFHIAVNAWATSADNLVSYYRQYFDWSKASRSRNPQPATRLSLSDQNLDADALFLLRDPSGIDRAMSFPPNKALRILFVFEHPRTAELVATHAYNSPLLREYSALFFLKTLADIGADSLRQGWLSLDPQQPTRPLF